MADVFSDSVWIVDCQLENGEYQIQWFVAGERLASGVFPQLDLATDNVFAAAE